MKMTKDLKPLTRAESELMNLLWDHPQGLSVKELMGCFPEPQPAYTTVGTFLKILEAKGFWQWAYLCLLAHADTGEVCDAGVTRRERHHFWQFSKEDALVLRTE